MHAAVTMLVHGSLLILLRLLRHVQILDSPQLAPLATTLSGAPLPCQVELWHTVPTRMR